MDSLYLEELRSGLSELLAADKELTPADRRERWVKTSNELLFNYLKRKGLHHRIAWTTVTFLDGKTAKGSKFLFGDLVPKGKPQTTVALLPEWLEAHSKDRESITRLLIEASRTPNHSVVKAVSALAMRQCIVATCSCAERGFTRVKEVNDHFRSHLAFNERATTAVLEHLQIHPTSTQRMKEVLAAYDSAISQVVAADDLYFYFITPAPLPNQDFANAYFLAGTLQSPNDQLELGTVALLLNYIFSTDLIRKHSEASERALVSARQAATSTILARTLSHNTGSHSLNALASDEKLETAFKRIEESINKKPLSGAVYRHGPKAKPDNAVPSVPSRSESQQRRVWLGIYNNYLRERMDLLADITTATPTYETTKALVADMLRGFERNYLLTTTIAGADEFNYSFAFKLPEGLEDINASIPGDVLGLHCCWLVMENVVRNSAKHGAHPAHTPVKYTVEVDVAPYDYLRVTIVEEHLKRTAKKAAALAKARNTEINKPVLDGDRVRQHALGMLEMKAACAYLRKIGMDDIDKVEYHTYSKTKAPPLLRAIARKNGDFGYEFFLRRPKGVAFVGHRNAPFAAGLDASGLDHAGHKVMPLTKLQAGDVCEYPLLLCMVADPTALHLLIRTILKDINAFPHEILVCAPNKLIEAGLGAAIDSVAKVLVSMEPLERDHRSSVMKRTVYTISQADWMALAHQHGQELMLSLRRHWLQARMRTEGEVIPYAVESKLLNNELESVQSSGSPDASPTAEIMVDYAPHNESSMPFYERLKTTLGLQTFAPLIKKSVSDLDDLLLTHFVKNQKRAYVLRFPGSMKHVMEVAHLGYDQQALLTQRHIAYWLKGTVIIDERVQASALTDTYSLGAHKSSPKDTEIARVKHLLDMAGVFVPHEKINMQQNTFDIDLWEKLLKWLAGRRAMLSYTYVHLGVIEKFSAALEIPVTGLIQTLKSKLRGVRIIVISGRGKPHNLPPGELFLNYSAPSQYLTQTYTRSPVLLSALSHSARRLKETA